jgi:hypothetical protein
MARKNQNMNDDNNAEVDILLIRARNINSDLSNAAEAIANAFRPFLPQPQVIVSSTPPKQLEGKSNGRTDHSQPTLGFDEDEELMEVDSHPAPVKTERKVRERNETPRHYPQPKPMNGIDWSGSGTSLEEFIRAKKPSGHLNNFLAIAAWFKVHANTPSVTLDHIYNGYRQLGWGWDTTKDMSQNFREGMRTRRGWYEGDGKGNYNISDIGLKTVETMGSKK